MNFGAVSLMVWGCMGWNGLGILAEVEGRMDAEQYVSILEDDLLSSMEDSEIPEESFQQDIDPKHSSKRAQNWFKYQGIRLLDWPAQSPDPSPVLLSTSGNISRKELWKATKRRLEALGENSGRVGEDWGWRVSETNWEYAYKTWGSEWYKHREGIQSTKIHHIIWGQICVPMTGHFEILVPHSHGNQITWPKWLLNAKSLYFYLSCKHYAWFILALLQFSNLPKMTQHWHTFLSHCRYTDSDPNLTRGAPKWLMWNSLPKWLLITKWPANCAFNSQSQQELNRDDQVTYLQLISRTPSKGIRKPNTPPCQCILLFHCLTSIGNPPMTPLLTCHGDNKDATFHVEEEDRDPCTSGNQMRTFQCMQRRHHTGGRIRTLISRSARGWRHKSRFFFDILCNPQNCLKSLSDENLASSKHSRESMMGFQKWYFVVIQVDNQTSEYWITFVQCLSSSTPSEFYQALPKSITAPQAPSSVTDAHHVPSSP